MTASVRISDKEMMYGLLRAGRFGNALLTATSLEELRLRHSGLVGLRYMGTTSGKRWFQLDLKNDDEVRACVGRWVSQGADPTFIVYCQQSPPCTMNAEVTGTAVRPILRYHLNQGMSNREAMLDSGAVDVEGLRALCVLRSFLTPSSFDDVCELLDEWPDHVIEFTTFHSPLGWARGRNHVVWEVRDY